MAKVQEKTKAPQSRKKRPKPTQIRVVLSVPEYAEFRKYAQACDRSIAALARIAVRKALAKLRKRDRDAETRDAEAAGVKAPLQRPYGAAKARDTAVAGANAPRRKRA